MKKTTRIDRIALGLLLLVCYVYVFPRWADPNQNSRLDMVVAVVEDGTFQIDRYVENTVDYARVGDHYYSDKPPGAAFLGIPVYAGLKAVLDLPIFGQVVEQLGNNQAFQATLREGGTGINAQKVRFAIAQVVLTVVISVSSSVVLGLLLYSLLLGMGVRRGAGIAAVIGYGLLTPALAYAGAFYSHQLSAAMLVGAFALARGDRFDRIGRLVGIGFLLGYAVISEYPVVLVAGVLFLFTAGRLLQAKALAKVVWVVLPAAVLGVGLMAYNNTVFGGPFNLGYGFSEQWETQHQTGFMSLTLPHWDAIWGITFGAFRGLFFFSPLLLLGIPGLITWWKSGKYRAEWWVSLASVLVMFLFNSSSVMWWGGFAVGPRYFLPALPFLALALGFAFERWGGLGWFKILAALLAAWSLVATWGLTLAGQAFPSDVIANPLLEYALPNWQAGNIARNFGTIFDLEGAASLVPLVAILTAILLAWRYALVRVARQGLTAQPNLKTLDELHGH